MAKYNGPESATHYLEDQFGRLHYKRCELTGKWLFWCLTTWEPSHNTSEHMKDLKPLEHK